MAVIPTDSISLKYRQNSIDTESKRLLITNFHGTDQEKDLTEPANCNGFGRIRHFRRTTSKGWPPNPLPIDPAQRALGLQRMDILRAQAFQNAVCNWRCWYCFVPFNLLAGLPRHSAWLTPSQLIEMYLDQQDPPQMIDLTGGQPDLVPEWIPWTMEALEDRGLVNKVFLWSDDNLSNDYFWRFLTDQQRERIASYSTYGKVCCFKGFNAESFSFNTCADPALFDQQFELMARNLTMGLDLYAYTTFTAPHHTGIEDDMARFVDRLQKLDVNLPLRTIPLEIRVFTPVSGRLQPIHKEALQNQAIAIEAWNKEIESRFTSNFRDRKITEVPLKGRP